MVIDEIIFVAKHHNFQSNRKENYSLVYIYSIIDIGNLYLYLEMHVCNDFQSTSIYRHSRHTWIVHYMHFQIHKDNFHVLLVKL